MGPEFCALSPTFAWPLLLAGPWLLASHCGLISATMGTGSLPEGEGQGLAPAQLVPCPPREWPQPCSQTQASEEPAEKLALPAT